MLFDWFSCFSHIQINRDLQKLYNGQTPNSGQLDPLFLASRLRRTETARVWAERRDACLQPSRASAWDAATTAANATVAGAADAAYTADAADAADAAYAADATDAADATAGTGRIASRMLVVSCESARPIQWFGWWRHGISAPGFCVELGMLRLGRDSEEGQKRAEGFINFVGLFHQQWQEEEEGEEGEAEASAKNLGDNPDVTGIQVPRSCPHLWGSQHLAEVPEDSGPGEDQLRFVLEAKALSAIGNSSGQARVRHDEHATDHDAEASEGDDQGGLSQHDGS